MIRRALLFIAIFGALQLAWQSLGDGAFSRALIERGVVEPAAGVARVLTPNLGVHSIGIQLRGPHGGINIVSGCDGMETLFLLIAGFSVAPLPLRARFQAMLVGIPVVYVLNLARILTLFYAHADMALFDALHGIITPILMLAGVAVFYHAWLRRYPGPSAA